MVSMRATFYRLRCRMVVCDFDPAAITTAQRKNSAPNVRFILADIRTAIPSGCYDNTVWAAIEHFTPAEIASVLRNLKERLKPGGILNGYTVVKSESGQKFWASDGGLPFDVGWPHAVRASAGQS
jgi:SAM-dependent methyltransferase